MFKGQSCKLFAYVDDCSFLIRTVPELHEVVRILQHLKGVVGLELSARKTHLLSLSSGNEYEQNGLIQCSEHVKILGIIWERSLKQTRTTNALRISQRMVGQMVQFKDAFVTALARVRFLNTYVYSQAVYYLQLFSFPANIYAQLVKYSGYYLWRGRALRVPRDILYLPMENGGLKLRNLSWQSEALRFHRLTSLLHAPYNSFLKAWLTDLFWLSATPLPLYLRPWQRLIDDQLDVFLILAYAIPNIEFDSYRTVRQLYGDILARPLRALPPDQVTRHRVHETQRWRDAWCLRTLPTPYV